jgi:hypothetical protein
MTPVESEETRKRSGRIGVLQNGIGLIAPRRRPV